MKKFLFLISILCLKPFFSFSQTTLSAGGLAVVYMNTDGDDDFGFVPFVDIASGTVIHFTERGYDAATGNLATGSDGTITWTANALVSAGTLVKISSPKTSPTASSGTASASDTWSLSGGGESIIAYQGTLGSPTTYIYLITTRGVFTFAGNSIDPLDLGLSAGGPGSSLTINTNLPPGLTDGTNALDFSTHVDNVQFRCVLTGVSLSDFMDQGNYNTNNTTSYNGAGTATDCVVVAPGSVTVAATVFLEGAYNGTNMNTALNANIPTIQPYSINGHSGGTAGSIPANAVDWVLVELREAGSAAAALNSTRKGSAAGFLMNDGTIKATDGTSNLTISLSGNSGADFFVVIYHRNHLPIMSASTISESSGTYTIDFTSNSANTHQTTTALATLSGGKFGMPSGDADGDGDVDATDLTSWRGQNGNGFTYNTTNADFNLDGVINAIDRNLFWRGNNSISKTRQVPST